MPEWNAEEMKENARRMDEASTPEEKAEHEAWLRSLPVLDSAADAPDHVEVVFIRRGRKPPKPPEPE